MAIESELAKEIEAATEKVSLKPADSESVLSDATAAVVAEKVSEQAGTEAEVEEVGDLPEATPVTPSAETPTPTQGKVSDSAIERAVRAGLTFSDARSFTSEEALNRVSASIENARKPVERHETEQEEVSEDDPFADLPKLDPEKYEEDVVKMYDGLTAVMRKQHETIKELRSTQNQALQSSRQAVQNDTEKWFDSQIESLGEDFHDILGKGSYKTLDQSGTQYAKRDSIANQCAILLAGYRASGQAVPPRDEVFSAAARLVLGSDFEKAHEKRIAADLAKRSTQHISRAGSKSGKVKGDPLADVAAMLDERYFGGKKS